MVTPFAALRASLLAAICTLTLGGCFDGGSQTQEADEHVWKDQTRTLDEARDVGNTLKDAATNQLERSQ